jgi:adhesin transport system outer membrane protein
MQESAEGHAEYPYVFLETGANWDANIDGTPGRNSDAYVLLRLNYELFSGGRFRAQEEKARHLAESRQYELDALLRELQKDAEQAWQQWVGLGAQMAALNDAARFTEDTRSAYYRQFSIGQRRLLDLLDIEREWLDARLQSERVASQVELARFRLLWLAGSLPSHLREQGIELP